MAERRPRFRRVLPSAEAEEAPPPPPSADPWLTLAEVRGRTTLGTSTIYRKMAEGTFPRPRKLGANCVRWRASWIAAWEASLPEADYIAPAGKGRAA